MQRTDNNDGKVVMDLRLLHEFVDDICGEQGFTRERRSVRGIVLDEENNVALLRCRADWPDGGRMDCYLTPGGGMEPDEAEVQTLHREMAEELGLEIEVLAEIGTIIDCYRNLRQRNIVCYFLVRATDECQVNRTDEENDFIKNVEWLEIDDAINVLEAYPADPRGLVLQRRDRCALLHAKRLIENRSDVCT